MEAVAGSRTTEAMMDEYCRTRDVELRNALVEQYAYIAQIAAKKFVGRGVDYDDLYQVALLALLRALERYDCGRGVKFTSFAMPSVIGEIKNYFRDKTRPIRLPRRSGELLKSLANAQEELTVQLGHPPKPADIARQMGISIEQVYELLEARNSVRVLSLDENAPGRDGEEGARLGEMLGVEENAYGLVENRDFLNKAMELLNEREKEVLLRRFVQGESQRAIAQVMGVSQMYISRMERKVLGRLREYLTRD